MCVVPRQGHARSREPSFPTGGIIRCLFETFFTLDAEEPVKRAVLDRLVGVAHEAAPGHGLAPLGAALVRKAAETGDSQAAYFLSLVPPTVCTEQEGRVTLGQSSRQAEIVYILLKIGFFAYPRAFSPALAILPTSAGDEGRYVEERVVSLSTLFRRRQQAPGGLVFGCHLETKSTLAANFTRFFLSLPDCLAAFLPVGLPIDLSVCC